MSAFAIQVAKICATAPKKPLKPLKKMFSIPPHNFGDSTIDTSIYIQMSIIKKVSLPMRGQNLSRTKNIWDALWKNAPSVVRFRIIAGDWPRRKGVHDFTASAESWPGWCICSPVFSRDIPGNASVSLSWAPNIALILLARAIMPSSCRTDTALSARWFTVSLLPPAPPRLKGLTGARTIEGAGPRDRYRSLANPPELEWIRRLSFACTDPPNPDLRLWVRLMWTRTPGLRGQRGAGVGCNDEGGLPPSWERDDSVGLGGPPSGLIFKAISKNSVRFFFSNTVRSNG